MFSTARWGVGDSSFRPRFLGADNCAGQKRGAGSCIPRRWARAECGGCPSDYEGVTRAFCGCQATEYEGNQGGAPGGGGDRGGGFGL